MKLRDYFDYAPYGDILRLTKYELAFCIGYFVFELMICLYSTPGGSISYPDMIGYENIAEHFFSVFPHYGNGPIYPLFIVIGMAFGLTLEQSAHIMPILCCSLLGLPLFLLGKIIYRPIAGYLTCIIMLFCGKYLVQISAYSLTDMPYLLITAIALVFLSIYNKYGYLSSITLAAIFTLAAELTRPIGITLFAAGTIVILINYNNFKFKHSIVSLIDFLIIAGTPFMIWKLFVSKDMVSYITTSSTNPPINVIIIQLKANLEQLFYDDYGAILIIILIICIYIAIILTIKNQLSIFLKNTIVLTSYSIIYIIILTIVTSSLWISVDGGVTNMRKVVQIFPFIVLFIILLFIFFDIKSKYFTIAFRTISMLLLICIIIQGSSALYLHANDLRKSSMIEFNNRELLDSYMSENNISKTDKIYVDISANWPNYERELLWGNSTRELSCILITTKLNGTIVFNKIGLWRKTSNNSLVQLIRKNNGAPIYIIMPKNAEQIYIKNSSNDIFISNLRKFSNAIIFKASIPVNSKFYLSNLFLGQKILDADSINKGIAAGNIIPADYSNQNHYQLLISSLKLRNMQNKDCNILIIDFSNDSMEKYEYFPKNRITQSINDSEAIILCGDFMGLGYDQALSIMRNSANECLLIEDFSQKKSPASIMYSEALFNASPFWNLTDPEDEQLAGDFLALGHSQVLFLDRNSNERRLVLADFSKNDSAQLTEIPLTGDSARIARWLDKDDLQFAGDFMGLGHSQVLFINRNHIRDDKEKVILLDFSSGISSLSIKYQENWSDRSLSSYWLDANDNQLVGDFMGRGHSQMLFVNHGKNRGKIAIMDFSKSKGKLPASIQVADKWNSSDLFEGWLSLNDTKIAGDFKGLGYDQVLFLNSSSNGTNAVIVDFISGKPSIVF